MAQLLFVQDWHYRSCFWRTLIIKLVRIKKAICYACIAILFHTSIIILLLTILVSTMFVKRSNQFYKKLVDDNRTVMVISDFFIYE